MISRLRAIMVAFMIGLGIAAAIIIFVAFATPAAPQGLAIPTDDEIAAGQRLVARGDVVVTYQRPTLVRESCGNPDGCGLWQNMSAGPAVCQVRINVNHPDYLREVLVGVFVAECARTQIAER